MCARLQRRLQVQRLACAHEHAQGLVHVFFTLPQAIGLQLSEQYTQADVGSPLAPHPASPAWALVQNLPTISVFGVARVREGPGRGGRGVLMRAFTEHQGPPPLCAGGPRGCTARPALQATATPNGNGVWGKGRGSGTGGGGHGQGGSMQARGIPAMRHVHACAHVGVHAACWIAERVKGKKAHTRTQTHTYTSKQKLLLMSTSCLRQSASEALCADAHKHRYTFQHVSILWQAEGHPLRHVAKVAPQCPYHPLENFTEIHV